MIDYNHPGGLFSLGLYGCDNLTDEDKTLLETIRPSGVILFQRNIKEAGQIKELIGKINDFLGYAPLVSIDQEGGIVSRLTDGFTVSPGAMALSRSGNSENAFSMGQILGKEMKALGIDWDLAPVVDINNNSDNPGIGVRSFGDSREIVTEYAGAFVKGLKDAGVIACLKHFPGKGRVTVDAHLDMPELDVDEKILFEDELYPYINIEAPSWMPSHVYYPALQSERVPASVSREVLTNLVRNRLNYKGVLISDDMTMGGITKFYSVAEGVRRSFYAGMDNLLICHDFDKQMESFRAVKEEVMSRAEASQRMKESLERMEALFALRDHKRPDMSCIASEEHLEIASEITSKSVEILKNEDRAIPMTGPDLIYSIELARKVQVEDTKEPVPPAVTELAKKTGTPVVFLNNEVLDNPGEIIEKARGKKLVLFTENAHLNSAMRELIGNLSEKAGTMVVCAMRNPYDSDIEGVRNIICSYGYSPMQQSRMIEVLTGQSGQ